MIHKPDFKFYIHIISLFTDNILINCLYDFVMFSRHETEITIIIFLCD